MRNELIGHNQGMGNMSNHDSELHAEMYVQ